MAVSLVVNGTSYSFPQTGNESWGDNVTNWATAVTSGMLQKAGGTFTLTADANFGTSFGLLSKYFTSSASNPASTGVVRLANAEGVYWRNAANSANIGLVVDSSDNLIYNGGQIGGTVLTTFGGTGLTSYTAGDLVYWAASTAFTKLAIGSVSTVLISTGTAPSWGTIVNASVNASAAIVYSKLSLTGGIVNADINASAAIVYSKLSLTGGIVNADVNASAAIVYSKLSLGTSIVNADISTSAAIVRTKLANITVLAKTGNYTLLSSDDEITGDTTSAGFTLTFPSIISGKVYYIKNIGTANTLTLSASDNINGASTYLLGAGDAVTIAGTASTWFIYGKDIAKVVTVGTAQTSAGTTTSATYAATTNSITVSVTPLRTGAWKIWGSFQCANTGATATTSYLRVIASSGSPTVVFSQEAGYQNETANQDVTTLAPYTIVTLTANTAYTFRVEGKCSAGTFKLENNGPTNGQALVAQEIT